MQQHDRLIRFLESEARFLRERIAHLREREVPVGVTSGDAAAGPLELSRADAEAKLAEVEEHLSALRRHAA